MADWLIGGRPIKADEYIEFETVCCSECGGEALSFEGDVNLTRHCPHCGTRMDNWQSDDQRAANYDRWSDAEAEKSRAEYEARRAAMTPEERAIEDAIWAASPHTGGCYEMIWGIVNGKQ